MRNWHAVILGVVFILCAASLLADEVETPAVDETVVEPVGDSVVVATEKPSLLGTWTVIQSDYILQGELTLNENGSYEKTEMHKDSVKAGVKGKYVYDDSKEPFAIDICLGECDGPGSEWTTTYGILRFLNPDKIEIKWSETGERPAEFAAEPDHNTVILARKTMEETEEE